MLSSRAPGTTEGTRRPGLPASKWLACDVDWAVLQAHECLRKVTPKLTGHDDPPGTALVSAGDKWTDGQTSLPPAASCSPSEQCGSALSALTAHLVLPGAGMTGQQPRRPFPGTGRASGAPDPFSNSSWRNPGDRQYLHVHRSPPGMCFRKNGIRESPIRPRGSML